MEDSKQFPDDRVWEIRAIVSRYDNFKCVECAQAIQNYLISLFMLEITQNKLDVKSEYFFNLLQRIKERPGMYLGKRSIIRLRMLLDGYGMARMELGLPRTEQESKFDRFQEWIQAKFNITSSQGWDSIILFYSVDERDAFEKFLICINNLLAGRLPEVAYVCTPNSSESTPQFTQRIASRAELILGGTRKA